MAVYFIQRWYFGVVNWAKLVEGHLQFFDLVVVMEFEVEFWVQFFNLMYLI